MYYISQPTGANKRALPEYFTLKKAKNYLLASVYTESIKTGYSFLALWCDDNCLITLQASNGNFFHYETRCGEPTNGSYWYYDELVPGLPPNWKDL